MPINIDMTGQVAIVTGGARGIGFQTASFIAEAGGSVMIADINGEAAQEAAGKLTSQGCSAAAATLDVRDPEQAQAAVNATIEKFGSVNVLVNNAAFWSVKWFKDLTPDDYMKDVEITLYGTMHMCRAVLDPMTEQRQGAIVNLISDAGRIGEPRLTAYSAAKGGVAMFTKALAKEVASYSVRVNGVSPGTTQTPGSAPVMEKWGGEETVKKAYPLGRIGQPSDIAYGILFLASPLSTWITGQILSVNGGYSMA